MAMRCREARTIRLASGTTSIESSTVLSCQLASSEATRARIFTAIIVFAFAQTAVAPPALESLVSAAVSRFDVAVAIVRDGQVVLARGYGIRQVGGPEKVDEHTAFYIASATKAFTVDRPGHPGIDDPVVKDLPEFALGDPALARSLTVRDLMAQRTGLPRADLLLLSGLSNDAVLGRLSALAPQAPVRSRFTYSNQMYLALGVLLERLAGAAAPDFLETRLLRPAGFADGNARGLGHWTSGANHAVPHARTASGAQAIDLVPRAPTGAGAVNASASDLGVWRQFQLDDGTVAGKRLVSTAVLAAEHALNTLVPGNATMPSAAITAYGPGWCRSRRWAWPC